jgi:GTP cyclohydrolase IA
MNQPTKSNGHAVENGVKVNGFKKVKIEQNGENLVQEMALSYRSILESVGEDPNREGLKKTPERAAKALMFFTKGYRENMKGKLISETK